MARIRSVKPELRRDLTVAEWPREVRYAWVLLWGYLDDHGRGLDDLRLLVADLFPLDRDVTERKLNGWLARMCAVTPYGSPPLCRYQLRDRRYLHAPKWCLSQKVSHPLSSLLPACPVLHGVTGIPLDPLPTDSGTDPDGFATSRTPEVLGLGEGFGLGVGRGRKQPPAAAPSVPQILAAYDAAVAQSEQIRDPRARGRIGRDAKALLAADTDPDLLVTGAHRLGIKGFADLGEECRRIRTESTGNGARTSTSDRNVAQTLALRDALRAEETR